ncbi:MAG: hypothetical protein JWQ35_1914, partial [Bacteriovoracaceae bacterium]|nr:hypothetical protein [Bacteriovoracaceae bacterium]
FKGRMNLDEKASQSLLVMVKELKISHPDIQISPSKLCSWIIENYIDDHFAKESLRIARDHFSPKRYLASIMRTATTDQDIREALKKAVLQIGEGLPISKRKMPRQLALEQSIKNEN